MSSIGEARRSGPNPPATALETLTVPATLDSLRPIGEFVKRVALAATLDQKSTYRLRLAVDELATNVVTHGFEEDRPNEPITLRAEVDPQRLLVHIEDTSPIYDPASQAEPEKLDRPLEEREIGGLGVFLALKGVDEFVHDHSTGRNHNILIMHRTAPS
jgi:serine/threonine-protein kinase RsbW